MCNKSLAFKSCDQNASWGISVRFHTLSLTHRQIAHALLTRPPLTVLLLSVRLECVKHAASVHPEPGSNSLKNCILPSFADELKSFFQSFNSKLLTLVLCVQSLINENLIRLICCCSIFKDRCFCRSSVERSCSISYMFPFVNTFFKSFFNFFNFFSSFSEMNHNNLHNESYTYHFDCFRPFLFAFSFKLFRKILFFLLFSWKTF